MVVLGDSISCSGLRSGVQGFCVFSGSITTRIRTSTGSSPGRGCAAPRCKAGLPVDVRNLLANPGPWRTVAKVDVTARLCIEAVPEETGCAMRAAHGQ